MEGKGNKLLRRIGHFTINPKAIAHCPHARYIFLPLALKIPQAQTAQAWCIMPLHDPRFNLVYEHAWSLVLVEKVWKSASKYDSLHGARNDSLYGSTGMLL